MKTTTLNNEARDEKHSKSRHRRFSAEEEKKRDFEMFFQGMKYQHRSDCHWINMNNAMHYGLYGKYPAMQPVSYTHLTLPTKA